MCWRCASMPGAHSVDQFALSGAAVYPEASLCVGSVLPSHLPALGRCRRARGDRYIFRSVGTAGSRPSLNAILLRRVGLQLHSVIVAHHVLEILIYRLNVPQQTFHSSIGLLKGVTIFQLHPECLPRRHDRDCHDHRCRCKENRPKPIRLLAPSSGQRSKSR
jgi:hypothetical protein